PMSKLVWEPLDDRMLTLASQWSPIRRKKKPASQALGRPMRIETWETWLDGTSKQFPKFARVEGNASLLAPTPDHIIRAYQDKSALLPATVMVFAWGSMARHKQDLLAHGGKFISDHLRRAMGYVKKGNIHEAWNIMRDEIGWSQVASSKCLHFMARSCDFKKDPPVPIDNKIIINGLWPDIRERLKEMDLSRLPAWRRGSWESYVSYMTAIITWAKQKNWTTTEVENTIFSIYKS
ncbi:MAG: hypothetical protein KAI47_16920, partial [Deltaproteobacteria bacterium]|nr:hypothetical protein [Deltaproteobacteria bacterium]